jgi:hypothetical protein
LFMPTPSPSFVEEFRKKGQGSLHPFPVVAAVSLPKDLIRWNVLSGFPWVFWACPVDLYRRTTSISWELYLYLHPQVAMHILTSPHLAFPNPWTNYLSWTLFIGVCLCLSQVSKCLQLENCCLSLDFGLVIVLWLQFSNSFK